MLFCPECKSPLIHRDGKFICQNGGHVFEEKEGIIQFTHENLGEERYFPENSFNILYQSEEKNFWFRVRNRIIGDVITKYLSPHSRILEVGCGTGFVSCHLKQLGFHIECADLFLKALQFCRNRNAGYVYYQYNLADRLFIDEFDAICAFDVLEHIDDDVQILRNMYAGLKPGGYLLITVPADMRLWGEMDRYAEHKRRYSAHELQDKLKSAGFNIIKLSYFMSFLFPVLFLSRKFPFQRENMNPEEFADASKGEVLNELQPNKILNKILYLIFSLEVPLLRSFNFSFGSSLLCVAVKES
jgi:SAM-dependent methyltransferase